MKFTKFLALLLLTSVLFSKELDMKLIPFSQEAMSNDFRKVPKNILIPVKLLTKENLNENFSNIFF